MFLSQASSARQQADLLQRSATCLAETQEEVGRLRRRRHREELMLREVEEALNERRRDLVRVATDQDLASERCAVHFLRGFLCCPPEWC